MAFKKYALSWLFIVVFVPFLSAQDIFTTITQELGLISSVTVTYKQNEIIFTARQEGVWKIFSCKKNGTQWNSSSPIENINSLLQPGENIEGTSISGDGLTLYFAIVNTESKTGDIYISNKKNGEWGTPEKLPDIINTPGLEGSPSVTPNGKSLFFTRPNPDPENDDYDARFIYLTEQDEKGSWRRPYKLPKVINKDCEFGPRIMPDGKTLVFSSVREKIKEGELVILDPMGDFDFYMVERLGEKIWTEPKHLKQMSSVYSDVFFTYALKAQEFLATAFELKRGQVIGGALNRKRPDEIDLLKIQPIYTLSATTYESETKTTVADYSVYNPYTSQKIASFVPDENNDVFITLPNNNNYRLEITKPGFSKVVKSINLKSSPISQNTFKEDSYTIKKEATLILNVFDQTIFEPLSCMITIKDQANGMVTKLPVDSVGAGKYKISFPLGKKYDILISKKAFETTTTEFDLSGDIYYFEFERDVELKANTKELEIDVADSETDQAMEVDIVVTNLDKNETLYLKARRGKDGKFKVNLREGDRYKVKVKNPKGYAYYTTDVDMSSRQEQSKLEVELVPLKAKTKLELKAITFEYNSAELRQSSFEELKQVVELLLVNPELKVEISAHSDDKGSDSYNLKLSERRAESVVRFLREQGLPAEKLVAKGYGESKPLVPNTSDENRAKNRRVELEILEANQE